MYFLYSLLLGLAALVTAPYWIVMGLRHGKYFSNLSERLGSSFPDLERLPKNRSGAIWIHAVSVGEALAGAKLAKRLKEMYPGRPLVVSTTTQTGQALVRDRIPFADAAIYFPLDWAFCVRRALDAVRPSVVVILETEIWPNFLHEAKERDVPVVFVSGRVSDRSFTRYRKYLGLFGFLLRPLFRDALQGPAAFLMQGETDAERVRALGAPSGRVKVSGNLKYDMELPGETPVSRWLRDEVERRGRHALIVAGSIVAREEPLALIAFGVVQGDYPKALLVLAPRKPERFEAAAEFIDESHRKFVRRSQLAMNGGATANKGVEGIADDVTVMLLDSIGELSSLYPLADGVLVGGSLVDAGGHNILEPAAVGKVPVYGPSMENFSEISQRCLEADGAVQVGSPEDAGVSWIELLRNPERNRQMGQNARGVVESSRGATERAVNEISELLRDAKE